MRGKRLRQNRRGMTLVEVLLAVAILALVAAPVLSIYLSSAQDIAISRRTTDATLTAQSLLENLTGLDYAALFDADTQGVRKDTPVSQVREDASGTFWYTIEVRPYALASQEEHKDYISLFLYSDDQGENQAFAAGSDGQTIQTGNVTGVSLQVAGEDYHLIFSRSTGGSISLNGKCDQDVLMVTNAVSHHTGNTVRFTLTGQSSMRLICRPGSQDFYPVDNAAQYLKDVLLSGDELAQSPVKATVRVYLDEDITQPLTQYSDILLVTGVGQ